MEFNDTQLQEQIYSRLTSNDCTLYRITVGCDTPVSPHRCTSPYRQGRRLSGVGNVGLCAPPAGSFAMQPGTAALFCRELELCQMSGWEEEFFSL